MLQVKNEFEKVEKPAKEVEANKENVLKLLSEIGICKVCSARIKSENTHTSIACVYGDYNLDELEAKKGSHCFLCLGILEEYNLCAVAKDIVQKMEDLKYESPTFALGVSTPPCALLHKSSMATYLAETIDFGMSRSFPALKKVVKFFLRKLIEKFSKKTHDPHSEFFIKLDYIFPSAAQEMSKLDPLLVPRKKIKLENKDESTEKFSVSSVIHNLSESDVKKYAIYPPKPLTEACQFEIKLNNSSLFFGGRYTKYSRTLSHTWEEGAAVEFLGNKLLECTRGESIKFATTGIEDVDVRILGKGKPFVAEIIDPKVFVLTEEQLAKVQADVSSKDTIAVHHLQLVNRAGLELMKKGEKGKVKSYRAKLLCSEKISDKSINKLNKMKDIELNQYTPIRLLHKNKRDGLKKIHEVQLERTENDQHYELSVKVEAGTYINEFVHGDFGRTEPSLRTLLGVEIDIEELDFISVDLNWPPELEGKAKQINGSGS